MILLRTGKAGVTLIELIVSLGVSTLILAVLYGILDGATEMWPNASSGERERDRADRALQIIERDLQQAVTDNGGREDGSFRADERTATFLLDSSLRNVYTPFLRFAIPAASSPLRGGRHLSLERVSYTYSEKNSAIYRTTCPLPVPDGKHLGELLEQNQGVGKTVCLIRRVYISRLSGIIPPGELINTSSSPDTYGVRIETEGKNQIYRLGGGCRIIYANSLPDTVFIGLSVVPENKWEKWRALIRSTAEDRESARKMEIHLSREIRIRTAGASRLP